MGCGGGIVGGGGWGGGGSVWGGEGAGGAGCGVGGGRDRGAEELARLRPLLFAIAYRMLGSVMDAEDIVQEAYLHRQGVAEAGTEIESPKSWLSAVVTRLCIDHLRSARVRREVYVGPWLPEPLLTEHAPDVADTAALSESLSMAFLVLLESLTPAERAAFLLHDVFGYEFAEIALILEKGEASCRQLARRARLHLTERRPRFEASAQGGERLTRAFMRACAEGELPALLEVLAEDVTLWSDGGGKVRAALRPIYGADKVARFLLGVLRNAPPGYVAYPARVNGGPGIVGYAGDRPATVVALDIADGRIVGVRMVVNSEMLGAVLGRAMREE